MKQFRNLPWQAAVLAALVTLCTSAAFAGNSNPYKHFAGVYESNPAPEGKSGPFLSMSLGPDGTATITQNPGKSETTLFGHWTDSGGEVVVTFYADPGNSGSKMVFHPEHDGLQAVSWDHTLWGKVSPPLAKKSSGNWHSRGHWWDPH